MATPDVFENLIQNAQLIRNTHSFVHFHIPIQPLCCAYNSLAKEGHCKGLEMRLLKRQCISISQLSASGPLPSQDPAAKQKQKLKESPSPSPFDCKGCHVPCLQVH